MRSLQRLGQRLLSDRMNSRSWRQSPPFSKIVRRSPLGLADRAACRGFPERQPLSTDGTTRSIHNLADTILRLTGTILPKYLAARWSIFEALPSSPAR